MRRGRRRSPGAFWSLVDRSAGLDACWPWLGGLNPDGYGRAYLRGDDLLAHRVAYELHHGVTLPRGQVVMHACDNRRCVNPAHLSPGTIEDNNRDCVQKGRHARGERAGHAKLSAVDVWRIRSEAKRLGYGAQTKLALRYGVSSRLIGYIVAGKRWRHLLPSGGPQ